MPLIVAHSRETARVFSMRLSHMRLQIQFNSSSIQFKLRAKAKAKAMLRDLEKGRKIVSCLKMS